MAANIPQGYYGINFPEYVFQPYPKWVTKPDGKQVIVQDAKEEARVTASEEQPRNTGLMASVPVQAVEPAAPLNERIALIDEAESKGVKIDKRWKNDRIRQAIDAKATE